jgi:hypothetical protein
MCNANFLVTEVGNRSWLPWKEKLMDTWSTELRVAALERRLRFLQAASVFCAAIVVIALLLGQSRPPANASEELRAQRFVLVDENGKALGELGVAQQDGSVRLVLRKGGGAWIGVRADGVPTVGLLRPDGIEQVRLTGGDREAGLHVFGDDDVEYVCLKYDDGQSSATLRMFEAGGKDRVMLGTDTEGSKTGLYLFGPERQPRTSVFVDSKGAGGVVIQDAKGTETWKAP